jgi:hypothetical protein
LGWLSGKLEVILPGDFRVDLWLHELNARAEGKFGIAAQGGGTVEIPPGSYDSIDTAMAAATFTPFTEKP